MREPKDGDYWCWGLLTSDLLEAMTHACKLAISGETIPPAGHPELGEDPIRVSQYIDVNSGGMMPFTKVVATIKVHRQ